MKLIYSLIFCFSSILSFSQDKLNWTVYDSLIDNRGRIILTVSNYRDSVFFNSFKTTIQDTIQEQTRMGFLWTKKYMIETHVFGPKWDQQFGNNYNNVRICTEPYGISFINRIEKK